MPFEAARGKAGAGRGLMITPEYNLACPLTSFLAPPHALSDPRHQGNAKALATVSAIIDGMGSLGAALGPMMTGFISDRGGFDMVFMMLYVSAVTAGALLVKLVAKELQLMSTRGAKPI